MKIWIMKTLAFGVFASCTLVPIPALSMTYLDTVEQGCSDGSVLHMLSKRVDEAVAMQDADISAQHRAFARNLYQCYQNNTDVHVREVAGMLYVSEMDSSLRTYGEEIEGADSLAYQANSMAQEATDPDLKKMLIDMRDRIRAEKVHAERVVAGIET